MKLSNIRKLIRETLEESMFFNEEEDVNEERIVNPDSKEFVKKRKNFIGSHIFGEDIGGLGKMYAAFSYGEHFPLYLYYKGKWYHNTSDYELEDGSINNATEKHREDMRPTRETHGEDTETLKAMISKFKKKHGIKEISHTSVEPGEKN